MEDLWRSTEAQRHKRVFASGRGFWLRGQCQEEELGQAPGAGPWRLQVPGPWGAEQEPAVALGWVCWACALSIPREQSSLWFLPQSWEYAGAIRVWQLVRCTLGYRESSKSILCAFCSVNVLWFFCYPGWLVCFVSWPPNGLAFFLIWSSSAFILVLSIQDIL